MNNIYTKTGKLRIPVKVKGKLPDEKGDDKNVRIILHEAYCHNGHNLMCDVQINDRDSINLIYTDLNGQNEAEIAISAIVGDCSKKIIRGKPFKKGQKIRILCPFCRSELPVLLNCECGAPLYIFYTNKNLKSNYAESFCARIGCAEASKLRFSQDILRDYINEYSF